MFALFMLNLWGASAGWCATNWDEYKDPLTAVCLPCITNADCLNDRACWFETYCRYWGQAGVLCGDPACGTVATTTTTVSPPTTTSSATTQPPASSTTSSAVSTAPPAQGKKLVAFVANWLQCPPDSVLGRYSHVIVSFAVTYTWSAGGNLCDATCTLKPTPGCNNDVSQLNNNTAGSLVQRAHALGVKVLLSVGGAGMGGSWDLSRNRCWDPCLGKAQSLADQLVAQVANNGLDGVDVDYEDVLDSSTRKNFVRDLTLALRTNLNTLGHERGRYYELTHTPMDSALSLVSQNGAADHYYEVMKMAGMVDAVDYLLPQYYNGYMNVNTASGLSAAITHFAQMANGLFGGDASRVVFGMCLSECGAFNVNSAQAVTALTQLDQTMPSSGGVFFWSNQAGDLDGAWSTVVANYLRSTAASTTTAAPSTTTAPATTTTSSVTTVSSTTSSVTTTTSSTTSQGGSGTCGNGNVGNGVCANGMCCSQWGWCGTGSAYCGSSSTSAPSTSAPSTSAPSTTTSATASSSLSPSRSVVSASPVPSLSPSRSVVSASISLSRSRTTSPSLSPSRSVVSASISRSRSITASPSLSPSRSVVSASISLSRSRTTSMSLSRSRTASSSLSPSRSPAATGRRRQA